MDIRKYNRDAWNKQVEGGNPWTIPVGDKEIKAARQGDCRIVLTPNKPIPQEWLMPISGRKILCLASGGGQQGPVLAAAGALVTVFDNSPRQLDRDRKAAKKYGLDIETVEGDMRDLSAFEDESFELIVHPVSNLFVPDIQPVWNEAFRVLKEGGTLLSGFNKPFKYLFDEDEYDHSRLKVSHSIPYSDLNDADLDDGGKRRWKKAVLWNSVIHWKTRSVVRSMRDLSLSVFMKTAISRKRMICFQNI